MDFLKHSENTLRKSVLLLLLMLLPAFAGGQEEKKSSAPKSTAPAAKPSAPNAKAPAGPTTNQHTTGQKSTSKPGTDNQPHIERAFKKESIPTPEDHAKPRSVKEVSLPGGGKAQIRSDGQIRSVDRNGMHIEHNLHGERRIVSEHNGARIVTTGRHGGYVQRKYVDRGGHAFYSRTYYENGVYRTSVYRYYYFGGGAYYVYYPAYYYQPAYYFWAYNPWPAPVYWGWGWGGAPWYTYYGFTPYQYYGGPAFWLTDYVIAANLQAAYVNASEAPVAADSGLAFVPIYSSGTKNLEQGFSTAGNVSFADDRIFMHGGASVSYSFSVAAGQQQTVAYGIPTGGFVNNAPAEVSVNGVTVASLSQGLAGFGTTTPLKRVLWERNFTPGDYVVTLQSGGEAVNVYGIWQSTSQTEQPSTVANASGVGLTDEVKQAIAEEVKAQLQAEQVAAGQSAQGVSASATPSAPAGSEVPPALDPARRTFVVSTDLAVVSEGQECSLTQGDVITRLTDTPDGDRKVTASVTSSKKNECAAGKTVAVSVDDLQEMQNHFREQLDEGMKTMASKQGTGGMPKAPDTSTAASNVPPPTPDNSAAKALQDQQAAADQTEALVKQQAAGTSAGGQY
ncbi:MAG TPA: hypothetical protein VEK33_08315 [Terriglobales bacterium]|nr:hypothetical protein [Terriglobales bacterium]